eukprot:CAMPEP_0113640786 /NCGR_PEP_ID=MMETSP0017_2-20120614/21408_1 /TAXON_ID=2856 /ORGANISM="Cylindrotheca closterium" /LENGTH=576 /DNA_ID=CAMNT_0000552089 /DNA_START=29 /DNA_END=1759 /DNA_ORIENTATION=+ /assembly_acc=CAM_ASM_000147
MRFTTQSILLIIAVCSVLDQGALAAAKKPSRSSPSRRPPSRSGPSRSSGRPPVSKRRYDEEEDEEEEEFGFDDPFDEDEEDEYEEEERRPSRSSSRKSSRSSRPAPKKRPSSSRNRYDDYDDEYDRPKRPSGGRKPGRRGPPSRRGPPGRGRGSVVPYTRHQKPSTFTRGLEALKSSMPDPSAVKNAAVNSLNAARETTSSLSANLYREVKGLTSSELEQVMLKATRPDDTAVKGKHAERLVGVTYQISARYDIYDAVLRKLWSKMAEKDWRTTIKALYILHRFSADGAPEHAPSLKARLRELRRTKDPKRKDKFFSSKQLLAGDNKPENAKFKAFMSRYAHYVLLRVQCFGGMFDEIAVEPGKEKKKSKSKPKPITSTCLRVEHLDASALLLKAGVACQLKDGEECENTAIAAERVASDLIGLTSAVAKALNRALEGDELDGTDAELIKRWCEFYSEDLLPQTRSMVKRTTPKLDAFGLFLPSRMGATVSQDNLQKGLKLEASASEPTAGDEEAAEEEDEESAGEKSDAKAAEEEAEDEDEEEEPAEEEDEVDEGNVYDEYEYDVEEYYDDEEPF